MERVEQAIANVKRSGAQELYLAYMDLETLPDDIWQLTQLQTLILTGNRLTGIADTITCLGNLHVLDVSGNRLAGLPDGLCELSRLTRLECVANNIHRLPDHIGRLRNLSHLDAFGNGLQSLPDSISECHNLIELRLADNDLEELPSDFGQLRSLLVLDLSDNDLKSLPESFFQLHRLQQLYLNGNLLDLPFHYLTRYSDDPSLLLEKIKPLLQKSGTMAGSEKTVDEQIPTKPNSSAQRPKAEEGAGYAEFLNEFEDALSRCREGGLVEFVCRVEQGSLGSISQNLQEFDSLVSRLQGLVYVLGGVSMSKKNQVLHDVLMDLHQASDVQTLQSAESAVLTVLDCCSSGMSVEDNSGYSVCSLVTEEAGLTIRLGASKLFLPYLVLLRVAVCFLNKGGSANRLKNAIESLFCSKSWIASLDIAADLFATGLVLLISNPGNHLDIDFSPPQ